MLLFNMFVHNHGAAVKRPFCSADAALYCVVYCQTLDSLILFFRLSPPSVQLQKVLLFLGAYNVRQWKRYCPSTLNENDR